MEEMMETIENMEAAAEETEQTREAQEVQEAQEAQAVYDGEQTAAETVWESLGEELTALYREGWSIEALTAFSQDDDVRTAIARGQTVRLAAQAYRQRGKEEAGKEVMEGMAQEPEERRNRKRGVPALRTATTGSVPSGNAIERLSRSEFAKFSDDVYERLMAGEKIAL